MSNLPDFSAHGYRAEAVLGSNPEGGRTAYRGIAISDERPVVIKRFSFASGDASWEAYESHQRELRMLQSLSHPRIPPYLGDFQTDDGFCIVQDFCAAPAMSTKRTWSPQQVRALAASTLEVLQFLQSRTPPIVHRDLKPENILVDDDGNAYLVDFGLARADRARATTIAVGTPGYMPPEQLLGHELTTATDLYGLGASLMAALTGTPSGQVGSLVDSSFTFDLGRLPATLSDAFKGWLARLVAPQLDRRFASATEALEALDGVESVLKTSKGRRKGQGRAQDQAHRRDRSGRPTPQQEAKRRASAQPKQQHALVVQPARVSGTPKKNLSSGMLAAGGVLVVGLAVPFLFFGTTQNAERGEPKQQGVVCDGVMTLSESIEMTRQKTPVWVSKGCDATIKDVTLSGPVGIDVKVPATLRFENVRFQFRGAAVNVAHPDAKVLIVNSKVQGSNRGLQLKKGSLTIENSTVVSDDGMALSTSGGVLNVKNSTLKGKDYGLSAYGGVAVLENTSAAGQKAALRLNRGPTVTLKGGAIEGKIVTDGTANLSGLDTVKVDLGQAAEDTWSQLACAPLYKCLRASKAPGEFLVDARVSMAADGRLGSIEFVAKKLAPVVEACMKKSLVDTRVPGPDGKARTIRCTANGNKMAGGGLMFSADSRIEP